MRLLSAAVFAGLALIAGAVLYDASESREGDSYADAEEIVSAAFDVAGIRVESVRRLTGPYVLVKREAGECTLVDVSTQYENEGGGPSSGWWDLPTARASTASGMGHLKVPFRRPGVVSVWSRRSA